MKVKIQHPNAPENHPARCTYRQATGAPMWSICDCGVYSQWLIAGAPAMAKCAQDAAPPSPAAREFSHHLEDCGCIEKCPEHGMAADPLGIGHETSPAAREAWPDSCQHTMGYAQAGHRCPCDHDCGCRKLTCKLLAQSSVISSTHDPASTVNEAARQLLAYLIVWQTPDAGGQLDALCKSLSAALLDAARREPRRSA